MKPTDLNSFNTLSNLVGKGTTLVVQSTRMDFETNTYISELWKRSNGQWKSFKTGKNNFSNPKFGDKENTVFYVKTNRSCLLYTSPSPRDVEESRMPSSA